ncbi:MAG: DUF2290 domain-containing protein [Bacteroidota bacterium]|nr:DUF2290 domain-containing protein [Bacteroidota bacterium]
MPNPSQVSSQIKGTIRFMHDQGLVQDQRAPKRKTDRGTVTVMFGGVQHMKAASRNPSYAGIYLESSRRGVYSIRMLDEALVQLHYEFRHQQLIRHRLAYLPHPWLGDFHLTREDFVQNNINIDTIARGWPPTPFRFDFDRHAQRDVVHPAAHFTIGSVSQCRIPVTRPLTPYEFIDFLLRNLYDSLANRYSAGLPKPRVAYQSTITQAESNLVHMAAPSRRAR